MGWFRLCVVLRGIVEKKMASDTKRTLFAGLLIASLTLMIPFYLQFIGIVPENSKITNEEIGDVKDDNISFSNNAPVVPLVPVNQITNIQTPVEDKIIIDQGFITSIDIITKKYSLGLSSLGGGSLDYYSLVDRGEKGYQYFGGYENVDNNLNIYNPTVSVSLFQRDIHREDPVCSPCLVGHPLLGEKKVYNNSFSLKKISSFSNGFETVLKNTSNEIELTGDSLVVVMSGSGGITKYTTFYSNNFLIKHDFVTTQSMKGYSVSWDGGIRPTEKNIIEELTYSQGFVAQNKDIESVSFSPKGIEDRPEKIIKGGKTDWVGIRNKYFINALVTEQAVGGKVDGHADIFNKNIDLFVPSFEVTLDFSPNEIISINQFFGPLDVDIIGESNTYLDRVMNFGWLPIQPFSRSVLWILKTLHFSGLNYGIILILFAFLIRLITGPLTKKSFESTQKMQTVQPKLKKIQEKYKKDSQKLNQEMVKLYKTAGVNPMGGCLPMLIQMPLLFSLFIVFRSTIEFRGAPFLGWIQDLSQPDIIFNLPFHIPIYGSHVGLLPIVLGISMFLSQRLSMATMDKSQRPMMYMMTAFFFLLFNQFPSGLNIYYTVYNILNYFQQKKLKKA